MADTPEYGRYIPIAELGGGGMARVWVGRLAGVERLFALKYLRDEHLSNPLYLKRFAREAEIGLAVSGYHPNLVTTRAYDPDAVGAPVLVLDLVGPSLATLLGRLVGDEDVARWVAHQGAAILSQLAAKAVVHRDLSMGNLLVASTGEIKLTDFGVATRFDGASSPGLIGGTFPYASPELMRGEPVTFASDAFSLGAVLYEILTGSPPFGSSAESVAFGQAGRVPALPRYVPRDLRRAIMGLLVMNPDARLGPEDVTRLVRDARPGTADRLGRLSARWLSQRCPPVARDFQVEAMARGMAGERRDTVGASRRWPLVAVAVAGTFAAAIALWMSNGGESAVVREGEPRSQLSSTALEQPDPDPSAVPVGLEVTPPVSVERSDEQARREKSADAIASAIQNGGGRADIHSLGGSVLLLYPGYWAGDEWVIPFEIHGDYRIPHVKGIVRGGPVIKMRYAMTGQRGQLVVREARRHRGDAILVLLARPSSGWFMIEGVRIP